MIKLEVLEEKDGDRTSQVDMEGTTEGLLIDLACANTAVLLRLMQEDAIPRDAEAVTGDVLSMTRQQLAHDMDVFLPGMGAKDKRKGALQ